MITNESNGNNIKYHHTMATQSPLSLEGKKLNWAGIHNLALLLFLTNLLRLIVVNGKNALDQSYLSLWQLMNIAPDTSTKIIKPEIDIPKIED